MEIRYIEVDHQPCLNTPLVAMTRFKVERPDGESIVTMYLKPGEEIDLTAELDLVQ